jgi:hypothetical protein
MAHTPRPFAAQGSPYPSCLFGARKCCSYPPPPPDPVVTQVWAKHSCMWTGCARRMSWRRPGHTTGQQGTSCPWWGRRAGHGVQPYAALRTLRWVHTRGACTPSTFPAYQPSCPLTPPASLNAPFLRFSSPFALPLLPPFLLDLLPPCLPGPCLPPRLSKLLRLLRVFCVGPRLPA